MSAASEQRYLNRQLARNTAVTFLVLSLVLSLMGVFLYGWVSSSLFKTVDDLLGGVSISYDSLSDDSAGNFADTSDGSEVSDLVSAEESGTAPEDTAEEMRYALEGDGSASSILTSIEGNPQFFFLVREPDGNIIATVSLYYVQEGIVDGIAFDPSQTDSPVMMRVNGHDFRSMTREVRSGDSIRYLQTVANVDSEVSILHGFVAALATGCFFALILCAAASYLLSRRVLGPVGEAWEKQAEFVRSASHELRTPLAVIKTNQELLLEHPQDRIIDHFEKIAAAVDEADRLGRLATDLLSLTALDAGGADLECTFLNVTTLAQAMGSAYGDFAAAQGKAFSVECSGRAFVEGDEQRLRQLLSILLDNAFKYTDPGDSICLKVERLPRRARVSVRDTGLGIPAKDVPFVFDRFFRSDRARSAGARGEGLGLSIAKSIVEAHGGSISVSPNALGRSRGRFASSRESGVTVVVELPAAPPGSTTSSGLIQERADTDS